LPEENGDPSTQAGFVHSIKKAPEFLASVRQEMKLIERPTAREVQSMTVVVFAFLILFILYFYIVGRLVTALVSWFETTFT
jgi:preprotein translocase SecE subunit